MKKVKALSRAQADFLMYMIGKRGECWIGIDGAYNTPTQNSVVKAGLLEPQDNIEPRRHGAGSDQLHTIGKAGYRALAAYFAKLGAE